MEQYNDLDKRISVLERKNIYNYVDDNLPSWARPTVQKLVDKGIIQGNEKGELQLDEQMLRTLVIVNRMTENSQL